MALLYAQPQIMPTSLVDLRSHIAARSPTSASAERSVAKAHNSEPWKDDGGVGPYQYHPGGDLNVKKDAPSALNVVVIPNVTLPKVGRSASSGCIGLMPQ
jgi:hypothetical protein